MTELLKLCNVQCNLYKWGLYKWGSSISGGILDLLCSFPYTVPYQKYSYPTKYPCSDCAIYRLNIQVETKMVIEIYR